MPGVAPSREFSHRRVPRSVDHAIAEFSQGVQMMREHDGIEENTQIGDLVKALTKELSQQVRTKPHPLIYVILVSNFAFFLTVVFGAGQLYQRVNDLDTRVRAIANTDAIALRLSDMAEQQTQLRRDFEALRDRMDRILDKRQ